MSNKEWEQELIDEFVKKLEEICSDVIMCNKNVVRRLLRM